MSLRSALYVGTVSHHRLVPKRHELRHRVYWLLLDLAELAEVLKQGHNLTATPAMLSRHLIHRLGFTYKKIPDRDGTSAQAGARRAIRVAAPADAEDAS